MFEAGLRDLLADSADVAAALGSGSPPVRADGTDGIFPVKAPESPTLPCLVYTGIWGGSIDSMDGTNRTREKRLQIDCYAASYGAARTAAEAVRTALVGYRGTLSDGSEIQVCTLNGDQDSFEEAPFVYRVILDLSLMFAVPA